MGINKWVVWPIGQVASTRPLIPHYLHQLWALQVEWTFHPTLFSMWITMMPSIRLVLTAYQNFFWCFFVFVVCRFCTSKGSFGYVFLDLARCVFVKVFVRDWPKTKIWLESFRMPQISQNISCFGRSQNIYQNIAMLLGLSRLGNATGVV